VTNVFEIDRLMWGSFEEPRVRVRVRDELRDRLKVKVRVNMGIKH
jgi:hypothetical protein